METSVAAGCVAFSRLLLFKKGIVRALKDVHPFKGINIKVINKKRKI